MLFIITNQCMEHLMFCYCQYELICDILTVYHTWAKVGMTSYGHSKTIIDAELCAYPQKRHEHTCLEHPPDGNDWHKPLYHLDNSE